MKNTRLILIAFFAFLFSSVAHAQDEADLTMKMKGINPTNYVSKHKLRRYLGFEAGLNSYWTSFGKLELDGGSESLELNTGRSWVFKYNFLERGLDLGSQKVRFITGLGIETNIYRFENSININSNDDAIYFEQINLTQNSKIVKNNLKLTYLTLPLMFDFNTNPGSKSNFHIAVGAEIALKLKARTRTVIDLSDEEYEYRVNKDFHNRLVKPSAMLRVGFGNYTIFANYALTSLFKDNASPVELTPFQVGLRLVPL